MARLPITSLAFMLLLVPDPGLENIQHEMVVQIAVDHFLSGGDNQRRSLRVELFERFC